MACFERRILRVIAMGGLALLPVFPIHRLKGQSVPARIRGPRENMPQPAAAATPGAAVAAPVQAAPAVQSPQAPVAPGEPVSMLQQPAQEAQIAFANNRLSIHAENASLTAILHGVATQSGMHISGMGNDERVFGTFGPGAPRDVLADLLNGAAYNLVLLGDLTNGAPRELILTPVTHGGDAAPSQAFHQAVPDEAVEQQQEISDVNPPPPDVQPPPAAPGNPGVRTPQQLFEQLQQMRQAQQQGQQANPPPPQQQ